MCGIAGIASGPSGSPPSRGQLQKMCETLRHRGPDDSGLHLLDGVALGARRLAVIDLEGGHQPYRNETGSIRAVFNGEIYNYRELREELQGRGHRFLSSTDGEVIVHLWEEMGPEFPSRLNGMFAIALHDSARKRLLLVRDRFGIKPLYYCLTAEHLVFGSEIKALLASGLVGRRLDLDALGQYLSWEYVPAPRTLLEGVRKLEPGALLDVDLSGFTTRELSWWDLPEETFIHPEGAGPAPRSSREWEEAVDQQLERSVRRQLVADVPLGAFLSGGVDSSLVVAHMDHAQAFTIGLEDTSYSEVEWARRVAEHLGLQHEVFELRPEALRLFDHLMHFMDDPIGDFSIFPTFLVSQQARSAIKVALSGDGGDELFGGYETYQAQEAARLWLRVPRWLRRGIIEPFVDRLRPRRKKKGLVNRAKRFVEGLGHDRALGHARWRLFVGEAMRRELFTPEAYDELKSSVGLHIERLTCGAAGRSEIARALYVDLRSYLSDNCLVKVDRMSMACSLEVRVPFLDHELVELAFRVPDRMRVGRGESKPLLKRVAASRLPRECVYRPKEGFSIPIKNWLAQDDKASRRSRTAERILWKLGGTEEESAQDHLDHRWPQA